MGQNVQAENGLEHRRIRKGDPVEVVGLEPKADRHRALLLEDDADELQVGNDTRRGIVLGTMRTPEEIHREIDELSERRTELWHRLSEGLDSSVKDEIHALDAELDGLWAEYRQLKAQLRWGDRDRIIARARAEERLERHAA